MISKAAFNITRSDDCKQYIDFLSTYPTNDDVNHLYQMAFERDIFKNVSKQNLIDLFKGAMKGSIINNLLFEVVYPKAIQTRNLRLLKVLEDLFYGHIRNNIDDIINYEYIELLTIFKPVLDPEEYFVNNSTLNNEITRAICNNNKPDLFYLVDPSKYSQNDIDEFIYYIPKLRVTIEQYKHIHRILPVQLKNYLMVRTVDMYNQLKQSNFEFNILNLRYLESSNPREVKEIIDECYKNKNVCVHDMYNMTNKCNYLIICMCIPYVIMTDQFRDILTDLFSWITIRMLDIYDPYIHNFKLFMFTVGRHCHIPKIHAKIYNFSHINDKCLNLYKQLLLTELKLRTPLTQAEKYHIYTQDEMDVNYPFWVAYNTYCREIGDEVGLEESKIEILPDDI